MNGAARGCGRPGRYFSFRGGSPQEDPARRSSPGETHLKAAYWQVASSTVAGAAQQRRHPAVAAASSRSARRQQAVARARQRPWHARRAQAPMLGFPPISGSEPHSPSTVPTAWRRIASSRSEAAAARALQMPSPPVRDLRALGVSNSVRCRARGADDRQRDVPRRHAEGDA